METTIEKLNLQKADPNYYRSGNTPEIRDLDTYYYLTISGKCSPQSEIFLRAIEKLYAVAYAIKFISKSEGNDFVVPKMEGFWWIDGGLEVQHKFTETPEDQWNWKIVIRMPDFVEQDHYDKAIHKVHLKKPDLNVKKVVYEKINEGLCVQCLHVGSYNNEKSTIASMMRFIEEMRLQANGYHHEIYLSDPRKTSEEKLKTILRYPVKKM